MQWPIANYFLVIAVYNYIVIFQNEPESGQVKDFSSKDEPGSNVRKI
jgi:hypothetical protein